MTPPLSPCPKSMYGKRFIMLQLQAIIKVGRSSDIKFNNVQAYRAINYREVERLLSKYDNIAFVVFEEVKEVDVPRIRNIMKSFGVLGVIYNKDGSNDALNELGLCTVTSLKELQKYIAGQLGVDISTFKKDENENENNGSVINETDEEPIHINNTEEMKSDLEEAIKASNDNFDKVEDNNEIVENTDIMSKHDIIDKDDSLDGLFDDKDVEGITLDDIEKRQQYEEEIRGLQGQLDYALESIRNLSELRVHLEDQLKQYKGFIEKIQSAETVIEVTSNFKSKLELENKIADLEELISTLKLEVAEGTRVAEQLKESKQELADKHSEIEELQLKLENAASNEALLALNNRLKLEVDARLFITQSMLAIGSELTSTQDALSKKLQEVGALLKEYKDLEVELYNVKKERDTILHDKETVESQVVELNNRISDLEIEVDDSKQKLTEHEVQDGTYESTIDSLTAQLSSAQLQLDETQKALDKESMEVHRFQEMGAEELNENMRALEESNSTLAEEIGRLRRDKDDLQRQVEGKDKNISSLSEQVRALSTTAKALTRNVDAGETIKISCNYSGKAFILPVFGSGSFGITSTAVSLANALDGKVLLMDFDIVSPKIDTWYNLNPIVKDLPDISNGMKKTGFGALIEKGAEYVINHRESIINTVYQTKGKEHTVDYFSGAYTKIDMFKIMAVDFSEFLTYFGHEYDYIVVDLGRIGGSEITNALVRMFDEISFKNIIVGLHDGSDCRTLTLRVQAERLDRCKSIWVLNLAKSDRMDNLIKQSISTSKYVIFFREMRYYGEKVPYNKIGVLKDRLSKLIELILQ